MKIYGRDGSSNSFKVFWAADELGLSYERVDTGGPFGGNTAPAYLAMNPNGKVPTLVDDGVPIWESNAIIRYLGARYGAGRIWPEDALRRALADRWMDWASLNLGKLVLDARKAIQSGRTRDEALMPALATMTILEDQLGRSSYVAGDDISIADFPVGPWAYRFCALAGDEAGFPAVLAYRDRLLARPAFTKHIAGL